MSPKIIEFFKYNHFLVVYGITWVISVISYRKYFDTILKYFPMIIAYTFFTELLGFIVGTYDDFAFFNKLSSANDLVYNIYSLIFFPYFFRFYWKSIHKKGLKKRLKPLYIIAIIVFITNCFFANPLIKVQFYAIAIASIILAVHIIFYWLAKKENWKWSFEKYNLVNWVSLGLFLFYLIFPFIFLITFLDKEIWNTYNLGYIHKGLIILMYSLFSVGFIISRRKAFG